MLGLILMGSPGAGKGTLGAYLHDNYSFDHFSSGDLLRREVKNHTAIGEQIEKTLVEGGQVSDELITQMVLAEIKIKICSAKFFCLDGFPQTEVQKKSLEEFANQNHITLKYICVIVDKTTALERMVGRLSCEKCNAIFHRNFLSSQDDICNMCKGSLISRASDQLDRAKGRLEIFEITTKPLMDQIIKESCSFVIDGNDCPNDVTGVMDKMMQTNKEMREINNNA